MYYYIFIRCAMRISHSLSSSARPSLQPTGIPFKPYITYRSMYSYKYICAYI